MTAEWKDWVIQSGRGNGKNYAAQQAMKRIAEAPKVELTSWQRAIVDEAIGITNVQMHMLERLNAYWGDFSKMPEERYKEMERLDEWWKTSPSNHDYVDSLLAKLRKERGDA